MRLQSLRFGIQNAILLCVLIVFALLPVSHVFAQDPSANQARIQQPESVVERMVYESAIGMSGWAINLGGALFDVGYHSFVLQLGCWFVDDSESCEATETFGLDPRGQVGGAVNQLWQMVRDMFNILFIFALIYIGIRTILFTEDSSTRKMLGMLIVAALLINFSLYIAKVVVDFANFTAVQLHQNLVVNPTQPVNTSATGGGDTVYEIGFANNSIAGHVMHILKYTTFLETNSGATGSVIMFSILLLVFSFILAFTFAYAGIMLLFRFIAIVFYLIFSPFMFLAWIVPQFASAGKKWWRGFLGYAFYAPIFIFLIFISLYALQALSQAGFAPSSNPNQGFQNGFNNEYSVGMMNIFIFFTIVIGFVIASSKLADSIAKQSGAIGMSTANRWSKRVTTGAGAAAGAWTAGRAGSSVTGRIGKAAESASNRVPALGGSSLRSFGENMQKKKFGGASSYKERRDATAAHDRKRQDVANQGKLEADLKTGGAAAAAALRSASASQVEKLAKTTAGQKLIRDNSSHLNSDHVKALTSSKDENISETFKAEISEAHGNNLMRSLGGTPTRALDGTSTGETTIPDLRKASKDQLETIGTKPLLQRQNAARLTKKQLDSLEELARDGKIDPADLEDIKTHRNTATLNIAEGKPVPGGPTRDDLLNAGEGMADFSAATLEKLAPDISYSALRKIADKADQNKLKTIRGVLEKQPQTQPNKVPNPSTGELQYADRTSWTDANRRWYFLNEDPIGKELGK